MYAFVVLVEHEIPISLNYLTIFFLGREENLQKFFALLVKSQTLSSVTLLTLDDLEKNRSCKWLGIACSAAQCMAA